MAVSLKICPDSPTRKELKELLTTISWALFQSLETTASGMTYLTLAQSRPQKLTLRYLLCYYLPTAWHHTA